MDMYIANCTNQVQDFQYRLPEKQLVKQEIPIGGQIRISNDLSTPDIEAIISQHAIYGMVAVDEIDRTRDFIGVCYSVGKRVDMERVRRAAERNSTVLNERGKKIRAEAALAVNSAVEAESQDIKAMEFSVEEDTKRSGKDKEVDETIRVDRTAEPGNSKPRGRRK